MAQIQLRPVALNGGQVLKSKINCAASCGLYFYDIVVESGHICIINYFGSRPHCPNALSSRDELLSRTRTPRARRIFHLICIHFYALSGAHLIDHRCYLSTMLSPVASVRAYVLALYRSDASACIYTARRVSTPIRRYRRPDGRAK